MPTPKRKSCIGNTLRDIANESQLNKAEKTSLRAIAREYDRLQEENRRLRHLKKT